MSNLKLSDLSAETIKKIKSYRWDRIIEKHEGPESWESVLEYYDPEFMEINDCHVLLPISREQHPNISVIRFLLCDNGNVLTVFLKDTTYGDHWSNTGFISICEKIPGESFYLSILYHEWFIFENPDS